MARRHSAGILLYRCSGEGLEVLLAHMGGPFWQGKDAHAWSVPKGEIAEGEDPFEVACREFAEELGAPVPAERFVDLGEVRQSGGKQVRAWAAEGDLDASAVVSNTFTLEWPRGSGRMREFPEVDSAEWCSLASARERLVKGQVPLLDRLADRLAGGGLGSPADQA